MSFHDAVDAAHDAYKARHKADETLVDDVDPNARECTCLPCRQGLTHISPCQEESIR